MTLIPENIVEEVRLASDVVEVIGDYVNLKKKGTNYFGLCPFHTEKTGSFSVNQDKQIFYCFGCSAGGNVFAFIMRHEQVGFPEAIRILAKRAGIDIPEPDEMDMADLQEREAIYHACEVAANFFHQQIFTEAGKAGLDYMRERNFDDDALKAFQIGFAPESWDALIEHARKKLIKMESLELAGLVNKREAGGYYDRFRNRVMFPISNLSGKVIAFGGRKIVADETVPKYVNSPETPVYHKSNVLYGLYQAREAIREREEVVFVEGYTDVIRPALAGLKNVVATSGTALTELQAKLVNRYTDKVILLYDSDTAGAKATMRGADILVEQGMQVRIATMPEGEDPDSFVADKGIDALRELLAASVELLEYKTNLAQQSPGLDKRQNIESLVNTLARIQDGIERQQQVKNYAEKLKIDEELLWDEVRRLRHIMGRRRGFDSRREQVEVQLKSTHEKSYAQRSRAVEEELVRIMLIYPNAVPFVFSFMELNDFFNEDLRSIAEVLFQFYEHHARVEREDLVHYFHDPELASFVSKVVHQESKGAGLTENFTAWAADCLAKLQKLMLDSKLTELQEHIRAREQSGGDSSELYETWQQLQAQKMRITATSFLPR